MKILKKIKNFLTRKNFSDSKDVTTKTYGVFYYNQETNEYRLVVIHKNLKFPIGLISTDVDILKKLVKKMKVDKDMDGYVFVIKKISYFVFDTGDLIF